MNNEIMRKEMIEAVNAGNHALEKLKEAQSKLNSAGNWGILDMLGGGFFSTMIKRSKMDEANRLLKEARVCLYKFQEESESKKNYVKGRLEKVGELIHKDKMENAGISYYDEKERNKKNNL